MSVTEQSQSIEEQFENRDVEVDSEEVEERFSTLVDEYKVPEDEARRSVVSKILDENDIDRNEFYAQSDSENELVACAEISEVEQWIDMQVEVAQLWEPKSDAIAQVGLIADESGTTKFTSWAKSDLQELHEGETYSLENVVTDEYQGQYSVKLNSTTEIERLDADIETSDFGSEPVTSEGALVKIKPRSGLIKRCPEEDCTRVLQNGRCSEHGEVEGEYDMRIKGVLDDGQEPEDVIFDAEMTQEITGCTLKEAKDMAMDALDPGVVADEFRSQLIGRYFEIEGPEAGEYHLVDEVEEIGDDVAFEADAMAVLNEHFDL